MIDRLASILLGMSPRERWLLAGLFTLALPIAVVFLWIMPLFDLQTQAKNDLREAQNLQQWVAEMANQNAALEQIAPQTPETTRGAIGISGIEESLKQASLRTQVTQLARRDVGAITLRLEAVDFIRLTDWLDTTEPVWGYRIESFRFESSDRAGLITAEFQLELAE